MSKFKVGDTIPVSAILTITWVQPTKNGSARYNTDHGINLSEAILDQITIKGKPAAVKAVEPQDNAEEREKLRDKVCSMGMCSAGNCRQRKKDCPLRDIQGRYDMPCDDYVRKHPETQKIMEDYLAAESEPEKPKYWSGKVVCVDNDDDSGLTIGKVYTVKDGVMCWDDSSQMNGRFASFDSIHEWFNSPGSITRAKFIEYKGEAH